MGGGEVRRPCLFGMKGITMSGGGTLCQNVLTELIPWDQGKLCPSLLPA